MELRENKCPYQSDYETNNNKKCCDWLLQNNAPIFFCGNDNIENYNYIRCLNFLEKWHHDTQNYYKLVDEIEKLKSEEK